MTLALQSSFRTSWPRIPPRSNCLSPKGQGVTNSALDSPTRARSITPYPDSVGSSSSLPTSQSLDSTKATYSGIMAFQRVKCQPWAPSHDASRFRQHSSSSNGSIFLRYVNNANTQIWHIPRVFTSAQVQCSDCDLLMFSFNTRTP